MTDTRWMTYAELADALGIGGDSARNLVRRKRWSRKPGNDGLTRVGVPVEHLADRSKPDGESAPPINVPVDPPTDGDLDGTTIQVLTRHIERLERDLEALKVERDTERVRAAQVEVLTAILDIEKRRSEELRAERDRLLDHLTAPEVRVGLLARLRRMLG